ncbi:MAG: hypothetical protein KAX19_11170, partial [Candidatus Brocadiae bacterium]|nr:hypothetical protein [Candidatus Brocadiia bacterium]
MSKAASCRLFVRVLLIVGCAFAPFSAEAEAITIRSWDSATQRGSDLFSAPMGSLDYGAFRNALLARGHTILPGVSTLSASSLSAVQVFFHGTSPNIVTAAEAAALNSFVTAGGYLIVEANSLSSEQAGANSMLAALGLGSPYAGATGGGPSGTFQNVVTATTVGPLGDLRGLTFGSSLTADIDPTGGTLVGVNAAIRAMVEYNAGLGLVLAVGDPYGFGLFYPGGSRFNDNNRKAYLNFIEDSYVIPEPGTLALLC